MAAHPNLVITQQDVLDMRVAIQHPGAFTTAYKALKQKVDVQLSLPVDVPVPKDGGGGYTHERHKQNYQLMFNAAVVYQLSEETKYAEFVANMLLQYAEVYPALPLHPKRKVKSQNPGKLFWQSLNEAVWLVYTIQAYDLIYNRLTPPQKTEIEQQLLKPVALFLSQGQPSTFNKVHNHGTWATAGVGMAGYVMQEPEWVEKSLYDLQKSGKGGFLRQLDQLFSPQGYYNEGPYYQRYALMPFVTFAKAIENNEPERKIFAYRDGVLLKAIDTTIQLSYNGLFFPINDAIKSKGIDTIELVHGVTVAYGLTQDPGYLDIARQQAQIVLSGDGLAVAKALDQQLDQPYEFESTAFGDGPDGQQGALVVMRSQSDKIENIGQQTLLFKPAAQGLGHGHFDKLTWQFYDKGAEIVSDYGAARFLNVEAKYGGRYLPENTTYAKQTIAHNTVVVDEKSHFNGRVSVGNQRHPRLRFFATSDDGTVASAVIDNAYSGVTLLRTMALINLPGLEEHLALDLFDVTANDTHQLDLPLHYHGQLIETSFAIQTNTQEMHALGNNNGFQHLWLKGQGRPDSGLAKVTWLNNNGRFYTQTTLTQGDEDFLFTQIGANDPNFNLRNEQSFIRRVLAKKQHRFLSILEPHGDYNPAKEYTTQAVSQLHGLVLLEHDSLQLIEFQLAGRNWLLAINNSDSAISGVEFQYQQTSFSLDGRFAVFELNKS